MQLCGNSSNPSLQGTLRNGNYSPYSNGHNQTPQHGQQLTLNMATSEGDLSHSPFPSPEVRSQVRVNKFLKKQTNS